MKKNFKKISKIFFFFQFFYKSPEFWYGRGKILVKKNYTPGVKKKFQNFFLKISKKFFFFFKFFEIFWNFFEIFFHTRTVILFHQNFTAMGPKFRTFKKKIEKEIIFSSHQECNSFSPENGRTTIPKFRNFEKKNWKKKELKFFWFFFTPGV